MPKLIAKIYHIDDIDSILLRIIRLLLSIVSRTTYLELILEPEQVFTHVICLCAASLMIVEQLACHPLLLDELIDPVIILSAITYNCLSCELRQYLLRITEDDEQQLEALRQFKQAQLLRIVAEDINGILPVMKVSDRLTYLAEAIIDAVVKLAWNKLTKRYGKTAHLSQQPVDLKIFYVIGYGKLGGFELGYSSDLDLIFCLIVHWELLLMGNIPLMDGSFIYDWFSKFFIFSVRELVQAGFIRWMSVCTHQVNLACW